MDRHMTDYEDHRAYLLNGRLTKESKYKFTGRGVRLMVEIDLKPLKASSAFSQMVDD